MNLTPLIFDLVSFFKNDKFLINSTNMILFSCGYRLSAAKTALNAEIPDAARKKIMKALIPEKPKASAAFVFSAGSGFMTLFPIGYKTVQRYA